MSDEVIGEEILELVDRRPTARQPGFTKTCRMTLMESDRPLLTHEVCQEIVRRNPVRLAGQNNPWRRSPPCSTGWRAMERLASWLTIEVGASGSGQQRASDRRRNHSLKVARYLKKSRFYSATQGGTMAQGRRKAHTWWGMGYSTQTSTPQPELTTRV
jgi:hypothetical protein